MNFAEIADSKAPTNKARKEETIRKMKWMQKMIAENE